MPVATLRSCSYPGCLTLVKSGRCADHRQAEVNTHDPARQRMYNTTAWAIIRRQQLAKEPWCVECLRANIYTPATDVDHVAGWKTEPEFYLGQLQSLCHACHSRKTTSEMVGRGGEKSTAEERRERGGNDVKKIPNVENPVNHACP